MFYWNSATCLGLHIVSGCFYTEMADLTHCQRDHLKYILSSLYGKCFPKAVIPSLGLEAFS